MTESEEIDMKQEVAREIVQRLPSLYPLQTVEEEAIRCKNW